MLRLLALAAGVKAADWAGTNIAVTVSWDGNGNDNNRGAGGHVSFDSGADMIANGTGSCDVTIATAGVNFVHFFDAHVGASAGLGTWTISAHGNHQDTGSYKFLVFADVAPVDADITVDCQNDVGVSGPVFDSFPQDPNSPSVSSSFTWEGDLGSDSIVMDFGAGNAPTNFTVDNAWLTATAQGDGSYMISGLDSVNYDDVGFGFNYAGDVIPAWAITLTTV